MNNAIGMKSRYANIKRQAKAPEWLVTVCRIILWFTTYEARIILKCTAALGAVMIAAVVISGAELVGGAFLLGVIIASALSLLALMLTRDF